ncbi:MAG: IS1595 family transposase [Nitrospirota bacterium]|nr:IS1595 family transposase [Nitrospirota bacterium]
MEEYPRTLRDFEARFSAESACRELLFRLRWPDGFICPRCGTYGGWLAKSGRIICSRCRFGTTVTAGTVFQDSHQPLTVWFRAMWWMTNQKTGLSGLGLQRLLGLGSYRTAWMMLHKLRSAMVRPGRDRLTGIVEVDEAYVGGLEEGVRGRQTEKKAVIVVAAQEDGSGIGRIRMSHVGDTSAASLHGFVNTSVEPGSTIHTDDWTGYQGLEAKGYRHVATPIKKSGKQAHELLPRVHKVISLFNRWLLGTHQGAISHEHLGSYLNEFVFRFNRRTSAHRGKLFLRLAQQAVAVEPDPYAGLIKGVRVRRTQKYKRLG